MKKTLIAATIIAVSPMAAADYQVEIIGSFQSDATEIKKNDIELSGLTLENNYYFSPVKTEDVLLGEVAFLTKASHFGTRYNQRKMEINNQSSDGDNFGFHGRYVAQGDQNIIIEASLRFDDEDEVGDEVGIAGGVYLDNNTEILVGLNDGDAYETTFYVKGKTVLNTQDSRPIVTQAKIQIEDGNLGVEGEGDYYISRQTSAGIRLGLYLEDDFNNKTLRGVMSDGARIMVAGKGQHFVTEHLAVGGELGFYSLTDIGLGFKLFVTGRF